MPRTDLVAFFRDGTSAPIEVKSDSGDYRDNGILHGFTTAITTRGDGFRRVLFLYGDLEQYQDDPWIASIGRKPGVTA